MPIGKNARKKAERRTMYMSRTYLTQVISQIALRSDKRGLDTIQHTYSSCLRCINHITNTNAEEPLPVSVTLKQLDIIVHDFASMMAVSKCVLEGITLLSDKDTRPLLRITTSNFPEENGVRMSNSLKEKGDRISNIIINVGDLCLMALNIPPLDMFQTIVSLHYGKNLGDKNIKN
jgi:hypothetical protein